MGSRKGGRRGCPWLQVFAAWRLFLFWSLQGRAGEAKPRSRKASKGTGRKKGGYDYSRRVEFLEDAPAPESCVVAHGIRGLCAIRGSEI